MLKETTTQTVEFDREKFVKFKYAYNEAKEKNMAEFAFDGHGYAIGYAKYLIEYLESKFN